MQNTVFPRGDVRRDAELDLADILRFFWVMRWRIAVAALLGLLAVVLGYGITFLAPGRDVSHAIVVQFTFPVSESDTYPNGRPFNLSDIVSAPVLQQASDRLSRKGIAVDPASLAQHVRVKPYAVSEAFIARRYKERLDNKELTGPEIERLESQFKEEIQRNTRGSALITLSVDRHSEWSNRTVEQILHAIPQAWSDYSVTRLGVLDVVVPSAAAMEPGNIKELDYLVAVEQLKDFTNRIIDGAATLAAHRLSQGLRDPVLGWIPADFGKVGKDFFRYRLMPLQQQLTAQGIFRDIEAARTHFQGRLHAAQEGKAEANRKAQVIEAALREYESGNAQLARQNPGSAEPGNVAGAGIEYVDRMLAIGGKLSESEFRQDLATRYVDLKVRAEEFETRIREIERVLEAVGKVKGHDVAPPVDSGVDMQLQSIANEFNRMRDAYERLTRLTRDTILGNSGQLYRLLSGQAIVNDPWATGLSRFALWAMLGLLLGAFAGVMAGLFRLLLSSRPDADVLTPVSKVMRQNA